MEKKGIEMHDEIKVKANWPARAVVAGLIVLGVGGRAVYQHFENRGRVRVEPCPPERLMNNDCFDDPPKTGKGRASEQEVIEQRYQTESVTIHGVGIRVVKGSKREVEENGKKFIVYTIPKGEEAVANSIIELSGVGWVVGGGWYCSFGVPSGQH